MAVTTPEAVPTAVNGVEASESAPAAVERMRALVALRELENDAITPEARMRAQDAIVLYASRGEEFSEEALQVFSHAGIDPEALRGPAAADDNVAAREASPADETGHREPLGQTRPAPTFGVSPSEAPAASEAAPAEGPAAEAAPEAPVDALRATVSACDAQVNAVVPNRMALLETDEGKAYVAAVNAATALIGSKDEGPEQYAAAATALQEAAAAVVSAASSGSGATAEAAVSSEQPATAEPAAPERAPAPGADVRQEANAAPFAQRPIAIDPDEPGALRVNGVTLQSPPEDTEDSAQDTDGGAPEAAASNSDAPTDGVRVVTPQWGTAAEPPNAAVAEAQPRTEAAAGETEQAEAIPVTPETVTEIAQASLKGMSPEEVQAVVNEYLETVLKSPAHDTAAGVSRAAA